MGAFGPKNYGTQIAETCEHFKISANEALAGDKDAREYVEIVAPGQVFFYREFWAEADAKSNVWPLTNLERLDRRAQTLAEKAEYHAREWQACQAEAQEIAKLKRQMQIAPLVAMGEARKQEALVQQAAAEKAAIAERFAEQQRKERDMLQRAQEYKERTAAIIQERERKNIEDIEAKRRQLIADGFMPA